MRQLQSLLYPLCSLLLSGKLTRQLAGAMKSFGPDFGRHTTALGEELLEPAYSFFEVPAYLPHPAQGCGNMKSFFDVIRTYRPGKCCPEIVHLHFQPVIPCDLFTTIGMGFTRLSYLQKVGKIPLCGHADFTGLGKFF